jgi:hypothetical protein
MYVVQPSTHFYGRAFQATAYPTKISMQFSFNIIYYEWLAMLGAENQMNINF